MKSLKEFFGNNFDEYLVPEMLISPLHITPLLAKNSLHNYLNVAPQWSSMKNKWQQLESHIWSLGIKVRNSKCSIVINNNTRIQGVPQLSTTLGMKCKATQFTFWYNRLPDKPVIEVQKNIKLDK